MILQKSGDATGREMKVFPLERTSATSLIGMLGQVYARQVASTGCHHQARQHKQLTQRQSERPHINT